MSDSYSMKIVRETENNKLDLLCEVSDYSKIRTIIDDIEEFQVDYYDKKLENYMPKKGNFEYSNYEVYNLQSFEKIKEKNKETIQKYKNRIKELKENLKSYYQGGKYCEEIEVNLREEISTYQELIGTDGIENSYDTNKIYEKEVIESIIEDIIFVSEYLKPSYREHEKGLYIIIRID